MRTFIQTHDDVAFAILHSEGEPDHSVTPDHITAVEYEGENPEQFIGKKYNTNTKTWHDAEVYVYAILDEKGRAMEIRRTVYQHEADGYPLWEEGLRPDHYWANGKWNDPKDDEVIDVEEVTPTPAIEEDEEVRLKRLAVLAYKEKLHEEEEARLLAEMEQRGLDPVELGKEWQALMNEAVTPE